MKKLRTCVLVDDNNDVVDEDVDDDGRDDVVRPRECFRQAAVRLRPEERKDAEPRKVNNPDEERHKIDPG